MSDKNFDKSLKMTRNYCTTRIQLASPPTPKKQSCCNGNPFQSSFPLCQSFVASYRLPFLFWL